MLSLYVKVRESMRSLVQKQEGLTVLEYGIFAAFVLLFIVGAAIIVGPQIKGWIVGTITSITGGKGL